jgi:hypothetical protein
VQEPSAAAAAHGIRFEVVKLPEACETKRGFVLLPKRSRRGARLRLGPRFRRLARDDERLPHVLAGLHFLAVACLMLHRLVPLRLVHNRLLYLGRVG